MKGLKNYICFAIVILSALAFVLTSCGGGGGGDNPPVVLLTKDNAAKAGSAAIESVALVELVQSAYFVNFIQFDFLAGVGALNVSPKTSKSPLKSILNKAVSISKTRRDESEMHTAGSMPNTTVECFESGNFLISNATWTGPDDASDSEAVNYKANITANACESQPERWSGSMHVEFEGPLDAPTKVTISNINLTYTNTDTNVTLTMTKLTVVITGTIDFDFLTDGAMTLTTGTISGSIDGDPINVECKNYKIEITGGDTFSLSGEIKPSCLGFLVAVNTTTDKPLIFPGSLTECPTAGEIIIKSGAEIKNVKTVIEADTKINIYYDNTPVTGSPYPSCTNIAGLCGG
jgi:hypothetical protein